MNKKIWVKVENVKLIIKNNTLYEEYIYTRVEDKNTQINQNASIQQIEMLWKKRLGLTQLPLIRIINKLEWVQNGDTRYNIYKTRNVSIDYQQD